MRGLPLISVEEDFNGFISWERRGEKKEKRKKSNKISHLNSVYLKTLS